MNSNQEKAIIIGNTGDLYFLASSNDELIMRKRNLNQNFSIGDCIKVISTSNTRWNTPRGGIQTRRVVERCEKIAPFIEWQPQNNKNGIHIISDIISISIRHHPDTNKLVRCFRTKFLEEIYESEVSRTNMYTDEDLMQMKVVAIHIVGHNKNGFWAVFSAQNSNERSSHELLENNNRIHLKGIALGITEDFSRNGRNDIYFWVPYRIDQILFKEEIRGSLPKMMFSGNWVSFSVNKIYRMDEFSDVRTIDDVLPTRYYSNHHEVRVRVSFDDRKWNQKSYPELTSEQCILVADVSHTLEKYNRLSSFSDEAWVYYFLHEPHRNIRFVLSEKQEEWEDRSENERKNFGQYQSNEKHRNTGDYRHEQKYMKSHEESRDDSQNDVGYSTSREKSKQSSRNSNNVYLDDIKSETIPREGGAQNHGNGYLENQKFEMSRKEGCDERKDIVEKRNRVRERSRSPVRNENFAKRKDDFHVEDIRKIVINDYEREYGSRAPLRNENYKDQKYENHQAEKRETFLPPSRSKRSSSSKRDDASVPSSSKSIDESTNIQWNLKKLKKRYEYLIANDMDIPEKLKEDISNAILEEQRFSKKKTIDYSDFDDDSSGISEIRKRRELAKIEVNEEELKTYKELVILFREMLASPRVCEEMRRYDEKAMMEINRLIFDL